MVVIPPVPLDPMEVSLPLYLCVYLKPQSFPSLHAFYFAFFLLQPFPFPQVRVPVGAGVQLLQHPQVGALQRAQQPLRVLATAEAKGYVSRVERVSCDGLHRHGAQFLPTVFWLALGCRTFSINAGPKMGRYGKELIFDARMCIFS